MSIWESEGVKSAVVEALVTYTSTPRRDTTSGAHTSRHTNWP